MPEDYRRPDADAARAAIEADSAPLPEDARTHALRHLDVDPPDLDGFLGALPEPDAGDPLAAVRKAMSTEEPDYAEVRRLTEASRPAPSVSAWRNEPTPDPVLSRAGSRDSALLSVGEVAVLSGPGGLGKSTITLGLAAAAAGGFRSAFGLDVAEGPAVLVSFEDAPARIAARMRWFAPWPDNEPAPDAWKRLAVIPRPGALWNAGDGAGGSGKPGPEWARLWRTVRDRRARLAVIDPASVALADVSTSETGPVRAFLSALADEAAAHACGVLIVAHDTKAARNEARTGGDPGAGAIAGSAAWHDAARGALYLRREGGRDRLILEAIKSNYGPTGWAALIEVDRNPAGDWRGLRTEPAQKFDAEDLAEWRAEQKATPKAGRSADPDAVRRSGS